jgi:tetratricopeptide (TPR) repeat protein
MPEDPDYDMGFQLRCEGRYAEAKAAFQRVLARDAAHTDSLHQMALIRGFEGDFDGSLADLAALVNKFPNNLDVRYDLAMTQMMLGMYDEACANFRTVLERNPEHKAKDQVIYC